MHNPSHSPLITHHSSLITGGALRLKFIENFMENCFDAGLLHTNYRELTVNYHLIVSFWDALRAKDCCPAG